VQSAVVSITWRERSARPYSEAAATQGGMPADPYNEPYTRKRAILAGGDSKIQFVPSTRHTAPSAFLTLGSLSSMASYGVATRDLPGPTMWAWTAGRQCPRVGGTSDVVEGAGPSQI
jgi:hypothetical protein